MENCIVTKGKMGKPFRDLAQHYKVSIPELEKITYKYRKLVGEDDAFPSSTFINAELGKIPYKEPPGLVEDAHKIWEIKYSKDIIFDKDTEAIKSKEEAETLFPKEVIHLYFNSEGKVVLSVQEPVAEIEIKHRKDFPDWQNYNDYLLVMGDLIPESERDKEKKQLGPQPFTFNDGTTVTAPFKPNEQQVEALNAMSDFINSDEVSMTLSGYAGTGKTSLMELIAAKMKKEHKNIVFSASTNKAAAVLRDRVKKAGFTAQTLNKVFGISVEVDSSKPYDAANLVNKLKEAEITPGTIVVIDEASMINEENYRILNDIAKENGLKIIYTGDKGQLAPVNESQISKVFRDKNGKVVTLTKVERTEDNAILKEATAVRNGQPLSGESSFNSEGKGVAYMKPTNKEGKKAIVEAFVPMLKKNPDFFRILAYTNKAVADYNTAVRNALGYHDNTPRVGEPIVGYSNWGAEYDRRTKQTTYRFINSESYKVTEVKPAKQVYYSLDDGTRVQMTAIPITIEDAMGKRDKIDLMDIKGNPQNLQAATMLAKEKAALHSKASAAYNRGDKKGYAAYKQAENAIEKFLFINEDIKDPTRKDKYGRPVTLHKKTFDFGYAMTVHKSQGSTFTHVLVDDADISTARNQTAPSGFDASVSMLDDPYSAMEGAQAVNLGLDSASSDMQVTSQGNLFAQMQQQPKVLNTQTINREANNAANIRQQLEYVAVSRATDTVTIISNNVKTEDSPLNHLSKAEVSEASSLETNRKEMTPQLIQQVQTILSPLGNKVHGLADIQKYFQEHHDAFNKIQQAIDENREMQSIKEKAIADGTFMKAPNGKDTNLTERQWLQVRTKNFINWFGDWEKYAPKSDATERLLSKLNNIANSDSKYAALAKLILDNKALPYNLKYFKIDNNRNDIEGHAAMWHSMVNLIEVLGNNVSEEEVNKALLHELIHYNTEELLTAYKNSPENVPQNIRQNVTELYSIIDYAKKYITEHFNEKKFREIAERQNKNIGSRVFYAFDNQGSVEIDEFISEIFTNPGLQEILNSIPYKETNQTLWDKIKECIHDIFGIPVNKGSVLEEALKASTEFITKAKKEYDSVSKVVDENGEPLVVYHGTSRKLNNNSFKSEFIFASDNDIIGAGYAFQRKGFSIGIDYALSNFAGEDINSFRNHIDNHIKELENEIELGEDMPFYQEGDLDAKKNLVKELKKAKQEIKSRDIFKEFEFNVFNIFQNVKNPLTVDAKGKYWHSIEFEGTTKNTDEIAKIAKDRGYDGLIITNVIDKGAEVSKNGEYAEVANDYIAFESNQIKSATDNNGMFSTENDDIQMFIGKRARTKFEQSLRKARPDMSDAEIQSTLDFLHSLEDNKENTAYIKTAIRWVANHSITLPQDNVKARQAFDLARKKRIDIQKYNTLGELIASPEMQPKKKEKKSFNPDTAKTFSNKRTVTTEGGRVFTVYDVENTEEGQREVCKALAAHYEMSPWCLSTFTAKGEPTESAKRYWKYYDSIPRKIAYENGKPVAFNSNDTATKDGFAILRLDNNSGQMIPFLQNKSMYYDATFTAEELGGELAVKDLKKVRIVDGKKRVPFVDEILPGMFRLSKDAIDRIEWNEGTHAKESWWDMEDTHPQDTLSDSIIADKKTKSPMVTLAEYVAEEVGLLGTQDDINMLVAMQQENIPLTTTNVEEYRRSWHREDIEYDETDFRFGEPDQGRRHQLTREEIEELPFFLTPDGEVYGFVTPNGDIYLDETKISPEHPIHEYTHLWDRIVAKKNPKLWKRGVQLMKKTSLWKQIENDSNYGQRWKALQGMTASQLESLIASEVHARFVGEGGQQLLDNLAKEKGAKGIIGKLKQWILDFWKDLKATFSDFSDEEIQKLTLKDFNHMTMRDFADAVNFAEAPSFSEFQGVTPEQVKQAKDLQRNKIESIQGRIGWIEERRKWNKATREQLEELTKLQQDLAREQSLYDGLDTGTSTITINEYGVPQITTKGVVNSSPTAVQNVASISNKTEAYGVEISSGSQEFWSKIREGWQSKHPQGLVAYRKHGDSPKTFSAETVKEGWIGNPFSTQTRGESTVQKFYDWLVTGNNFGNERATEEFRQAIIQKILNTPANSPILYYTELNRPSHATVIGYLVSNKQLLQSPISNNITTPKQIPFDVSKVEFYSGAADGADKAWGAEARRLGIKVTDYTRDSWNSLSQEWKNKLSAEYEEVARALARPVIPLGNRGDIEVRRDMMQADKADAIFAIGTPVKPGQKGAKYINRANHEVVDGGTGYAVQRGILRGIPVYLYDRVAKQWKVWDNSSQSFVVTEEPTLTPHAAVIGTRGDKIPGTNKSDISEVEKQAIRSILNKTISQQPTQQQNIPASYEGMITPDANTIFVFGSNPEGRHGAGAAATAKAKFGAIQGQGEGLQGNAYALPTKDLDKAKGTRWYKPGKKEETEIKEWYKNHDYSEVLNHPLNAERTMTPQQIIESIKKLYEVANQNPDKQFKVSHYPFGKLSLNGYLGEEMLAMFKQAGEVPSNVQFNKEWTDHWNDNAFNITNQQAPMPEASPSEQTSQKVSLPGYEYFNDLYEDTEVDATWKIPILQDLDSQLSTENTEDENLQILSQMDRVLQSPSQEDYEKAPTPQKEETNKRMEDYLKRNQQLNNLLDNEVGLQASEIRDTAETIMNTISDIITEIQQHPEKATEYWPTLKTDKDLSKMSRKELVETVNINRLIELAKKRFDDLKWSEDPAVDALYNSAHLLDQHDLIMNNWDAVMRFAGDIFVANEGFGIKRNSKKSNYETEVREYQGYDYDDYSDPQDPDAIAEEGDEQEHWQVEAKTVDVINSMSELVRMAIHNCYVLDKSGNKVLDKWGMPKRVDKHKAVKQILYWTAGTLNINEMIDRMEAHKDRNPWVSQLTRKLADTSGNEADFQSQFYGVMHRHFQLYGIGQYEDGHYVHKILNRHNALSEVMKGISAQFQMHQHPLFNRDSTINRESLKLLEGWYGVLEAIKNKYKLMLVKSSGEGSREDYVSSNNLELSEADIEAAAKAITAASRMLGYMTTEEQVLPIINKDSILRMTNALMLMLDHEGLRAQAQANTKDYKPFGFKTKNNIRGALNKFLQPMMEELEETALNTIFEDGKMYQSNTIPSFLSQLFDSFAQSEENFKPWVESFYGNSQWFKKDGMWRTPWLATMMSNPDARKIFEHHVQLNFNKHNYMRNMSPDEYIISCITNYFFKTTDEKEPDTTEAWFRVPIQSNKPSSEFIKFFSFRGTDYKDKIVAAMQSFFLQELDRIDTVRKRNKQEDDASAIASWDENGRHFMFLPFLNSYLVDKGEAINKEGNDLFRNADNTIDTQRNNELKTLLNKKLNAEKALTPNEEARLSKLVEEATRIYMQNRADQILDNYEKNGILKAAEKIENIKDYGRSVRDNIENFLWNDFFAANNILQLTITDKAFYPTTAELQKRLAELHAPGTKANKYATDYGNPEKGIPAKRVSDGIYRTILISDYEGFIANIIDNLTEIFDRKIAQASQDEKQAWIALKESLVGKDGRYRKINVTDGQAYSSPSSYRKKMLMFGKWSPEAERTYQKIRSGNFTLSDLEAVFQPLKPFVYGHLHKKMGVQKAPIQEMNVPFQAKNSEYLLLMADALMQGQETGRPNLLHTIYDIMEESERLFPTKGIDTVQFNSAIKSGAQGVVHLSNFTESGAGREQAYTALREQMYVKNDKGEIIDYNYDTFVQSTDYDNYALQQEVPKHFQDHQQAEPSQKRANIMSDLDMWLNPQGDKADPANINYYTWKDPDGTEHKLNAQEFRKEYEKVHAKNIEDSFNDLAKLFHLDSLDRIERNIALSELLQEEIESSPRYGIDLMQACQIDPKTGDFRIPKGDPVQSKRIEQLINSIIKSRVNKQKLAGGPVVQVTNWGTSRQLHIRFNDRNGTLLPTKEEYESLVSSGKISSSLSYKDYIKENQAGIAHFEIFAPAAWKKHLEKFKNPDGTINLEAVEKCDPNLLRMITSRIPNEDKYSIAHGKIVGFLPEVAGEAIMFPYELTEIDDSDFDVDKRYCHVFEIEDIVEDTPKVRELLFKAVNRSYKKSHDGAEMPYNFKKKVNDSINMLLDNPEVIRHTDKFSENLYNAYQNILHTEFPYKVKYPKKGSRGDRNNQILNMDWAVMSNEMTASKILNPGGFDIPKHDAYVIAVYRAKNGSIKWEQLEGMTTKQLQKLMPAAGDLAWFDTQVQFYKQNAAGSNLIGVFAVNKVAHAILEADDILVDIEDVCGKGNTFTIADKEFKGRIPLDPSQDDNGAYIGKGLGSMVGASADTAKDPWLDLIGINMTTAGVYNTLLRLGMPQKDAALFMSQDAIVSALNEFNRTNLEETTTFDTVISKKLAMLRNKYGYNENSEINKEPITREELKAGLLQNSFYANDYKDKVDYKVLLAFSRLQNLAKAIRKPTLVTRLNSISSAVGPLIIDNIILEHKLMQFLQSADQEVTGFYSSDGATVDMDDIFYNHPMLKAFFKAFQFASNRFADMPAGSTGFKNLIEAFPESIREKLYEDRQLLSKLSDFYQSYMLVANGIINPEQIGNYINGFPDYFIKSKFKEKYPDNAFIQAIQITFDKKAGRGFLNINTTGMMEQEKERLRMAWTDLHKVNPKLSTQLFTYAFFRGGIGFSPKTWMGLVSTYVKEHLTNQRADSAMTSYVDTYRNFPTERMVDSTIMKQFVRNNWDNSKLAPKKGGEGTAYDYSSLSQGTLRVHSQKDMKDLQGIPFIKTVIDKKTYLWERVTPMEDTESSIEFRRIMPLGNNGEYVEMSLEEDMNALENVEELRQNNEQPELPSNAQKDAATSDDSSAPAPVMSVTEQAKSITDIVKYMITSRGLNEKVAADYVATLHKKAQDGTISKFSKQDIQRIAKDNGLNLDVDAALEWFKNLC